MISDPLGGGPIWDAWNSGGALVGPMKPHTRVTVEPSWMLNLQFVAGSRSANKLPIRWFQRADNSQSEIEIPGIRSVEVNYSIDQDADELTVELSNNLLDPDYAHWVDVDGDFGRPGYLTPDRGDVSNRWGYQPNEWSGLLTREALIRTYEGFGGQDKTLAQALADGNLVRTGVWLVDDVPIKTGQTFTMKARNMMKLLIDQQVFGTVNGIRGLVPDGDYPFQRSRYFYIPAYEPIVIYGSLATNPLDRILRFTRPPASNGYTLIGTDGGVFTFGLAHFYGSIESTGAIVPPPGAYPAEGITGIAYTRTGQGYWIVSDDGAVYSFGDATYHGGASLGDPPAHPAINIETAGPLDGYWILDDSGTVHAFGSATNYGSHAPASSRMVDMASTSTGLGYWLVDNIGQVYAFGDAVYHGGMPAPPSTSVVAIAPTPTNGGYYITDKHGDVYTFGDAPFYGSIPGLTPPITLNDPVCDIIVSADGTGYWLCAEDGGVFTFRGTGSQVQFMGSLPGGEADVFPTDGNYCLDEATEIFTSRGWLKWNEVYEGDFTLSLDPLTKRSHWEQIQKVNIFPAEPRRMISMKGSRHSSLSTPDHRWLAAGRSDDLRWSVTEDLLDHERIPTCAKRDDAPLVRVFDDEFVELVAWYWTEGCCADGHTSIAQSITHNPDGVERVERCLKTLFGAPGRMRGTAENAAWNRTDRADGMVIFRVASRVASLFWNAARTKEKVVDPGFLCALTQDQLDLFIETSIDADGHRRENGTTTIRQASLARTRAFEMACALAGRSTITRKRMERGKPMWSTTVLRSEWAGVASLERNEVEHHGLIWCPTLAGHNWLARRDGTVYFTGNTDLTDIFKDLVLYSGFYLYDNGATEDVFGNVENTGIFTPDYNVGASALDATFFDKLAVIDPINKLKEIVGFVCYCDSDGAIHWHEPNVWQSGNYLLAGTHTTSVPTIDERVQLTSYEVSTPDKDLRSAIIIATADPEPASPNNIPGTPIPAPPSNIVTAYQPATASELRGLVKPAMWVNEVFTSIPEQIIMCQLIALHIYFKSRLGSVNCIGNPLIYPNDQVQILERETFETNVHYVRSVQRKHDRKTGEYTQTMTTNVLNPSSGPWAVVRPDSYSPSGTIVTNRGSI